jgi:DNA-3-methyladenine glycosylase II
MFLMFHLGRLDVWAPDDLGIRKAIAQLRGTDLPTRKQMDGHGLRYAPYRTLACWYLWRSLEL